MSSQGHRCCNFTFSFAELALFAGFLVVVLWVLLVVGEILGRGGSFDNEKIGFWSVDPREEVDIEDEDEDEDEDDEGSDYAADR